MTESLKVMLWKKEVNKDKLPTKLFIAKIRRGTARRVEITWKNTTQMNNKNKMNHMNKKKKEIVENRE